MVGIYADCNLSDRSFRARAEKVIDISFNRLIDAIRVVPQVKQFELRIAKRPGLPSEIASALWQKRVHIQAFSAQLQEGQEIFHLAVDKAAVAKQTFIENGWKATEETAQAQTSRIGRQVKEAIGRRATRCAGLLYPS